MREVKSRFLSGTPRFIIETPAILALIALAVIMQSANESLNEFLTLLGVVALGSQRLIPVAQQIYSSWISIEGGKASVSDALELFDEQTEIQSNKYLRQEPLKFNQKFHLKNISFEYENKKTKF